MTDIQDRNGAREHGQRGAGDRDDCGCHVEPLPRVKIKINGADYVVSPGKHRVAAIKEIAGVPECDELAIVVHGKLRPLADGDTIEIAGHEQFLACARSCPSS